MRGKLIETQLIAALDKMSNGEMPEVEDEWIEEAGEQFKAGLRKQVERERKDFRIRMSNIGRPLCQLQMEAKGAEPIRRPYNHIVRMMIGDAVEVLLRFYLKISGVDVTADGDKVELPVGDAVIKGESDIDIEGFVYDIKSASPYSFAHKWQRGYKALAEDDGFGYIGQLLGYADGQGKEPGGWLVADKSSGEIAVVDFEATEAEKQLARFRREDVVETITEDKPFKRCFEEEPEFYYGKPTGAVKLPPLCGKFCDFRGACWPDAKLLPQPESRAKSPPWNWYITHPEMD